MKVLTKPRPQRRFPQAPCPKHGTGDIVPGVRCDVVGIAANRFITWRCGRWQHMDAVLRKEWKP